MTNFLFTERDDTRWKLIHHIPTEKDIEIIQTIFEKKTPMIFSGDQSDDFIDEESHFFDEKNTQSIFVGLFDKDDREIIDCGPSGTPILDNRAEELLLSEERGILDGLQTKTIGGIDSFTVPLLWLLQFFCLFFFSLSPEQHGRIIITRRRGGGGEKEE
jgi:hypothetical protein